jgi:hypothetical protein
MAENKLIESLQYNLDDYDQPVEITPGYSFDMYDTINRIELYRASRFQSGNVDSQNNRKYFFNITNPQCGNATKNIDLDRKDIRVRALRAKDRVKSMLYNDELKHWMRKENFGIILNKTAENLPIYGSFILKKVGKMVMFRPLKRLRFDPAVSNSPNNYDIQSPYMIDEHSFTAAELEDMIDSGWDKDAVKEMTARMRENREKEIIVYEQYTEAPNSEIGKDGDGYSMSVSYIGFSKKDKKSTKQNATTPYVVLFSAAVDKIPYKKLDYLTIEGRAMGLGVAEMLFPLQERRNEMGNQKAVSMKLSSGQKFQTRDQNVDGNILTDLLPGDILKVNSEITQIATEERNLSSYQQEENNIKQDTRDNANSQEILTGESLPSRTPFRLGALQQQNAAKLFDFIRENMGMFFEEVIKEWIIPEFEKATSKEHVFEIYSRDTIKALMKEYNNKRINEVIKKNVLITGSFPTEDEIQTLDTFLNAKLPETKFAKVVAGYYKDFEKDLDIDITGEKHDSVQKIETLNNTLMLLAQNPQITQNPELMNILENMLELTGMSPSILPSGKAMQPSSAELGAGNIGVGTANAGSPPIANA